MKKQKLIFGVLPLIALFGLASCQSVASSSSPSTSQPSSSSSPSSPSSSSASNSSLPPSSASSSSSSSSSSEDFGDMRGSGTEADPYLPLCGKHLDQLRALICGVTAKYVVLTRNIDLSDQEWSPIGTVTTPANIVLNGGGFKITNLSIINPNSEYSYGLFGTATGLIKNLSIAGTIDVDSASGYNYAGLLAGNTNNLQVENVRANGTIRFTHDSTITDDIVTVGGLIGNMGASDNYYISMEGCQAAVNISAPAAIGIAGGLVGGTTTYNGNSLGILAINSCVSVANTITASYAAGGILGSAHYYTSVVNSVAEVTSIATGAGSNKYSFAGGIVGSTYYENAYLFNIAKIGSITADATATGSYVSDIGDTTANGFEAGGNGLLGAALYGNIATGATLTGQNKITIATPTPLTSMTADGLAKMGFKNAWLVQNGKLPTLVDDPVSGLQGTGTVTLHGNNGTADATDFPVALDSFTKNVKNTFAYANHTLIDMSYDKDSTIEYRWYAPINVNLDIYDNWFDATTISGWHVGADSANPIFNFNMDGALTGFYYDYSTRKGTWWADGTHFRINIGSYENVYGTINADGTLEFVDINADYYTYTYSKAAPEFGYWKDNAGHALHLDGTGKGTYTDGYSLISVTYTITGSAATISIGSYYNPFTVTIGSTLSFTLDDGDAPFDLILKSYDGIEDYTGNDIVGTYTGVSEKDTYKLVMGTDGNADCYKNGSESVYGENGYRLYGTDVAIRGQGLTGDFIFNKAKAVLVKKDGSALLAKTGTYQATYATTDKTIRIYAFSDTNYLVTDNSLSDIVITGTLGDGQTITIGNDSYTISGTTLTKKASEADVTPLVATYTGTVNGTSVDLNLKADKTGTYGTTAITFTYDGTTVSVSGTDISASLTFDSTAKTLTGSVTLVGTTYSDITFAVKTAAAKTLEGTWTGKGAGGSPCTIIIGSDNTATFQIGDTPYPGTWAGSLDSSIIINCPLFYGGTDITVTLDSTKDSVTITYEDDDYTDYSFTFNRAA